MTISVDLDGVVCRFTHRFNDLLKRLYPEKDIPPEDEQPSWDWDEILTLQELDAAWEEVHRTPEFWYQIKPFVQNVVELEMFLKETHADAYFITSRKDTIGETALEQSKKWLGLYKLDLSHTSLICAKHAHNKKKLIKLLEIQYSIDDHGPTVEECQKLQDHQAYLLDWPYNRQFNVPRVNSMKEFLDIVRQGL